MRWVEDILGKFRRKMKLRRRGFRFVEPKDDCIISLGLVCKTFQADVYHQPLRNVILRAARREPQKYQYLMVREHLSRVFSSVPGKSIFEKYSPYLEIMYNRMHEKEYYNPIF